MGRRVINLKVHGYDENYDNYMEEEWSPQEVWDCSIDNDWFFYGVGIEMTVPYLHVNGHLSEWDVRITHDNFWEARFLPKYEKNTQAYLLKALRKIGPVVEHEEELYV